MHVIQDTGDAYEVVQHAHEVEDDPHKAVDNADENSNDEE